MTPHRLLPCLSLILLATLLPACSMTGSSDMADPVKRQKAFPFSEQWPLHVASKDVRQAVIQAIGEVGVTRSGFETSDSAVGYLESDYQGVIAAETPFGEKVLLLWQAAGEKDSTFEIRRRTADRTYLSYALATHTFKILGLDIPVAAPTTNAATFPAKP